MTIRRSSFAIAVLLALPALGGAVAGDGPGRPVELYFEAKLLVRDRVLLQRVAVDQWAGGRLLLEARPFGPGTIFELVRPLEDPWTFRWYPTRDEVKLGAAVAVAEPSGDPYGALAAPLTEQARQRYAAWWEADRVTATADRQPGWQARAERFWADRHVAEIGEKDPLPEHPVYPFHVLGDPRGRVGFVIGGDGAVVPASITETMSAPWLADGWAAWQRGERSAGYGYWESKRPDWEPRTYQALAAAVALLAWSPWPVGSEVAQERLTLTVPGLPGRLARFFETLTPRCEGHVDWEGPAAVVLASSGTEAEADSPGDSIPGSPELVFRVWRFARRDAEGHLLGDELQAFVERRDGKLKAWLKVGYQTATP